MKEIILKIFITAVLIGVDVLGITFIGTNLAIGIGLIIFGTVGIIITLLFSRIVKGRGFWQSVLGLPRGLRDTYRWKCDGPRYQIDGPIFKNTEVTEISQGHFEAKISATVRIWIKNKSKPLKINIRSTNVCLEQRVGQKQQKSRFRLNIHQEISEIMLKPREEWYDQIVVSRVCRGDSESYPVIKKRPRCGVWEIWVTLPRGVRRQLHKGANCQPSLNNEILV